MRATDLPVLAIAIASACTGADYELGALVGDTVSGGAEATSDDAATETQAISDDADGSGTGDGPFVDPLDGASPIKLWVDTGIAAAVGGVWDDVGTALLVADAEANAVLGVTLGGVTPLLAPAGDPRALAIDIDGALLVGESENGRLVRFDGEAVSPVASGLGSPGSIAVARSGRRYVTDATAGTVHRIDPDGTLHLELDDLPAAGGAAVDPTDAILYIAARGTPEIHALALGPAGEVASRTAFAVAQAPLASVCVDEHGNVLAVGDAGLHAFRPDGASWGSRATEVPILDCSFGSTGPTPVLFLVAATAIYVVDLPVTGAP